MNKLREIFLHKECEVAEAKARLPLSELKAMAAERRPRSFVSALSRADNRPALIAEVKKASPSQGLIRASFDPVGVALAYGRAGAHCLSVLTDERYFQGSPENLRLVREVTELPILRKDFLFDPYQVYEARAWGADAILIIVAGVRADQAKALLEAARELDLDALVEVHDEAEAEVALQLGADLIGVNNRDLSTFRTDLSVTERVLPLIKHQALTVSESALTARADVERAAAAGADAVLIGTAFCSAPDIEGKVREVMPWSE
jgi:indole-3-glycerol phosphate synthase